MLVIMLWIKCHTGAMQEDNNEIEKEDRKRNSEKDETGIEPAMTPNMEVKIRNTSLDAKQGPIICI